MLLILLALALSGSAAQSPASAIRIDVSAVRIGTATTITEVDLGKLKGEPYGGRLILMDQQKHKQAVSGVSDGLLPAWSMDGSRLAWLQKSGRRKYALRMAPLSW